MERLTCEGNFCDIAQCRETPGGSFCESGACSQRKVWERLKAYEDTGLEPEDLKRAFGEETVLKLAGQALGEDKEHLKELAQADKEGRVVVLPCAVGDAEAGLDAIDSIPAAGVAQVVRCGVCRNRVMDQDRKYTVLCEYSRLRMRKADFCSYGEREADKEGRVAPARHGRWVPDGWGTYICDCCGIMWNFEDGGPKENDANYCPACGAKMDGEADDGKAL